MGGWDTSITQNTIIHPAMVKTVLFKMKKFTKDFNKWLDDKKLPSIKIGRPTGSSSYYEIDSIEFPNKVYGDIDLQMIAKNVENSKHSAFSSFWNKQSHEFIRETKPSYIDIDESKAGHPIFKIGNQYAQIDFMWSEPKLQEWAAARMTPERNIKGSIVGNLHSVLGELLNMSIQHAGVQFKTIDNVIVPFSKQKNTHLKTISIDPRTFILDIFSYEFRQTKSDSIGFMDSKLLRHTGNNPENVTINNLVLGIKGLASSFEMNKMYGHGMLVNYTSANDFITKFITRYEEKALEDINGKKRNKAITPTAIARAEEDRQKILYGLEKVKQLFS